MDINLSGLDIYKFRIMNIVIGFKFSSYRTAEIIDSI